jgi:hypothetical protein
MKQTRAAPQFAHYAQDWHFSPVLISGDFAVFSGQTGTRPYPARTAVGVTDARHTRNGPT